jgi:hypothetical protein
MKIDHDMIMCLITEANLDGDSARWGYSGRGMNGKGCFALIGSIADFGRFIAAVPAMTEDIVGAEHAAFELADRVCVDNMGLDLVFYGPHLPEGN